MNNWLSTPCRRRSEDGFTLIEVIIAVALLGLVVTVLATSFQVVFKTQEVTSQRYVESLDAQTASAFLANDVQSMVEIGGSCGSAGSAVVSFDLGDGDIVTYRHRDAEGLLVREACGSGAGSIEVARWLDPDRPVAASCDGGGCAAGTRPRVVEIPLSALNRTVNGTPEAIDLVAFDYTLTGARRTYNSDGGTTEPSDPDLETAPFIALTPPSGNGAGVLKLTGTSLLKVHGPLVVDSSQPAAVEINLNSDIVASRFFIRKNGTCVTCTTSNSSPLPVPYDETITNPYAGLTAPLETDLPIDPPPVGGFFLPGRYTSTIEIKNNPTSPKNFLPGVYILEAGLTVSGTPTVTGNDVLFYNKGGTFDLSGATATITGNSSYAGAGGQPPLALWQPVSNTAAIPVDGTSTSLTINGGIYAPGSEDGYKISNGSPVSRLGAVIATNVTLAGGGTVCVGDVSLPCP